MRKYRLLILLIPLIIILVSCASEHSKIVVAEYGDYKIKMDEFEKAYLQSAGSIEKAKKDSLKELESFIDLYVNFKMKLRDAEVRGYKEDEDLIKEYQDYKQHIGSTLFLETSLYEPNIRKLYERRKTEYRVSHLFLAPDSTINDQKIRELGDQLIQRIKNGEDFNTLVAKYSADDRTRNLGGDVYFITAGLISSRAIEDAIYGTEPGMIYPTLVKSQFGYHILKVTEKHSRRISLHIQHILIRYADSSNVADTTKALKKIQEIEKKIKDGANFGTMAQKYSQDVGSANKNGDIGMIQRGMTVRPFDEVAFKLKVGEVSPIVKTQFGFHLIKVMEESPYPEYDSDKENLKQMYQRISYQSDYDSLIAKLKKEMDYQLNTSTYNKILADADTTKMNLLYFSSNFQKQVGNDVLFKINGKPYISDSLFSSEIKKGDFVGRRIDAKLLNDALNKYTGDLAIAEKALSYDKENPEFAKMLDDYKNGMYLFKLLDEEIWKKISIDSVKVKDYHETNRDNFRWKDRVEFKEIYVQQDSAMNKCYQQVTSGISFDTVYVKSNQRTGYENKYGYNGLVDVAFNELSKQASALKNIGDISKPFQFENGWSIVKLIKRDAARLKTFDEAKTEAASALQEKESKKLEEAYLDKLKSLYHPKIYYDELRSAFKR